MELKYVEELNDLVSLGSTASVFIRRMYSWMMKSMNFQDRDMIV